MLYLDVEAILGSILDLFGNNDVDGTCSASSLLDSDSVLLFSLESIVGDFAQTSTIITNLSNLIDSKISEINAPMRDYFVKIYRFPAH